MNKEVLLALADRAEQGGDDTLSDDVWRALGWEVSGLGWVNKDTKGWFVGLAPDLKVSLDAVELLPKKILSMWNEPDCIAAEAEGSYIGQGPTECLARLNAKLLAMAEDIE